MRNASFIYVFSEKVFSLLLPNESSNVQRVTHLKYRKKKNTIKKVTYLDLLDLHQTIPTRAIKKLMQSGAEKAFRCRLRWVDFVNLSFRPSSFKRISCEIFDCQNFVFFLWNILDFRMFKILKLLILRFSKAPTLGEVFKTQMRFSKASISTVKTFLTFF